MPKIIVICLLILGMFFGATQIQAALVTIENNSFESPYLEDDWGSFSTPGWSIYDSDIGIMTHTMNPSWYLLNQFEIDGRNVLSANGGEYTYQILTSTLSANSFYTLTVDVGNIRSSIVDPDYYWAGYAVQFWAGDTMLAEDNSSLHPDPTHFLISTVNYLAAVDDPLLGAQIQIRLMSLGSMSKHMAFDKVELNATPVPVPATILLLAPIFIVLTGYRSRFNTKQT